MIKGEVNLKIADCGSTWSKILDLEREELEIVATADLPPRDQNMFHVATGHSARGRCRVFRNELIALAEGGLARIDQPDFSLVDIGSRDIKYVRFKDRKVDKLDWNLSCGSTTGATIELMGKYYGLDFDSMEPSPDWVNVACGVFGMERVLESVSMGTPPGESVAMFIHGLIRNVYNFAGRPSHIYLSGGFCENGCFTGTMERYCRVTLMGRTVPLEGIRQYIREEMK